MTSAENVRFLTGVQRVTRPTCATLKSGLQLKSALTPVSLAAVKVPRIAAEKARRPVRIPVVVERPTEAPGFSQMKRSVTAGESREKDSVCHRTEAKALISTCTAASAEHREAVRRGRATGDHVF